MLGILTNLHNGHYTITLTMKRKGRNSTLSKQMKYISTQLTTQRQESMFKSASRILESNLMLFLNYSTISLQRLARTSLIFVRSRMELDILALKFTVLFQGCTFREDVFKEICHCSKMNLSMLSTLRLVCLACANKAD